MAAWGLNTRGPGKPYVEWFRSWQRDDETVFLGMPDVYSEEFARGVEEAAQSQCEPHRNDPLLLGYFLGNEPPWPRREGELVDRILAGPESATQNKLKAFLAEGDTPERRKEFVLAAFEKFLELTCAAVRKYDPNHLILGLRYSFGANPTDEILKAAGKFDVCTINPYEYDPTECCIERAYELSGRPILISEFHFGVAENGLAAGLGPVASQKDRGIGYRHYVEQGATHPAFIGAHWFTWRDQPVLGVGHDYGENYNIGIMDLNDRPYPELIEAMIETHKRLYDVHAGKVKPFDQWPKASEAGIRTSPWEW
jgi:hypothetical protein